LAIPADHKPTASLSGSDVSLHPPTRVDALGIVMATSITVQNSPITLVLPKWANPMAMILRHPVNDERKMPRYIVTYDLKRTNPDPHAVFLKQARTHGWNYWLLGTDNVWRRLPNTTLQGMFETLADARKSLDEVKTATEKDIGLLVVVEKMFVAGYTTYYLTSDKRQRKK
jgi:hypothetical protein